MNQAGELMTMEELATYLKSESDDEGSKGAAAVRGPKYVVRTGKTPVLGALEARQLLDSIDTTSVVGLRDRAPSRAVWMSIAIQTLTFYYNLDVRDSVVS